MSNTSVRTHAFTPVDLRSTSVGTANPNSGWRTFKREAAAFWRMLSDAPGELNRMADEFEAIDPDKAALLRKAARQPWGWGM